jgi:hypothetical protein
MTKRKAARDLKLEWSNAVREGRVVSYNGGERFKSFPTTAQAEAEVLALKGSMPVAIARPVRVGVL